MQVESTDNPQMLTFVDGHIMNAAMDSATLPMESGIQLGRQIDIPDLECVGSAPYSSEFPSMELADFIYSQSIIARNAVTILPTKAFSLLKSWEDSNKENTADVNKLMQVWKKVLQAPLIEAACMARKYSDAYVILFFDDTEDLSLPLNTGVATKLVGALARSRHSVHPNNGAPGVATTYTINQNYYEVKSPLDNNQNRNVHHSRIIHIPGLIVDSEQKRLRSGYNLSIFNYLSEPLDKWVGCNQAGIAMLKSHSAFTMGIAGMAWKTGEKDITSLKARFASILSGLKRVGGLFFDKDQEQANFISRSYSGVDKLLEQLNAYLANSSDIPKEFLFNSATSPFTEEGLGSRYAMAEVVNAYITTHVNPIANKLFPVLAEVYGIKLDGDSMFYEAQYESAMTYTRKEKADIKFKNSQHDAIYLNSSTPVFNAETVRTRWESGYYSDDVTLVGPVPLPQQNNEKTGKETARLAAVSERGAYTTQNVDEKTPPKKKAGSSKP